MSDSRWLKESWCRIIGLLALAAALALLGGCSAIRLAYNNLQDISYWWIDGYADLNEAQTLQLRADLAQLHLWHRSNELPKIADLLQKVQKLAPADTTADQVCSLFGEMRERIDTVTRQALPQAAALALKMEPGQIKHIEARFEKANTEWRSDWAPADRTERFEKRLKASVERAEQFYGTLDEGQRAVLKDAIVRSRFDPQRSLTERRRRQQDLLQTLRDLRPGNGAGPASQAQASAAIQAYLDRVARSPNPQYQTYSEYAIKDNCRTYAQLHNSMTAQQRARAIGRLAAYERDARELSSPS